MAKRRAEAAAIAPEAGHALVAHWPIGLPLAGWVAGYVRFRSEIDPAPLMAHLAKGGARLCLPAVSDGPLVFRAVDPNTVLVKSRFGVMEPPSDARVETPSIVLVPLLAFDGAGHRLGYGQGHYDRTLAALRARGSVVAIGLAYGAQKIEALTVDPHDQRLDFVLTPEGAFDFR